MSKLKKARELTDARIQFVSLVDRAANMKQFLITKAAGNTAAFLSYGTIIKANRENHYITGIVYEPNVEDSQGEYMTAEEIQKAAYWFAKHGDMVDIQHSFIGLADARVVENWITKSDTEIGGVQVKKGTWLITVETDNPGVWDDIQKGKLTGFSMGGTGTHGREDISLENQDSILKKLAKMLSGDKTEKSVAELDAIAENAVEKWADEILEKSGKQISCKNLQSLKSIHDTLAEFLAGFNEEEEKEVQKAELTKDDIIAIVEETVKKLTAKTEEPKVKKSLTTEEVTEIVEKAVADALVPVLKQAGVPSNLNAAAAVEKAEPAHFLAGIL